MVYDGQSEMWWTWSAGRYRTLRLRKRVHGSGDDVRSVDTAVALADYGVDTSAWLDATFMRFVTPRPTKQPNE